MQLDYYDDPQLGGFFSKVTSSIKKAVSAPIKAAVQVVKDPKKFIKDPKLMAKTVTKATFAAPVASIVEPLRLSKESKTIKKIAVPIAHAAAAYFTGGATLALSAKMLMEQKQKKAQEALLRGEQAEYERQMAEIRAMQEQAAGGAMSVTTNPEVATPAAPRTNITAVAPTQAAVQQQVYQAQVMPGSYTLPSDRPEYREDPREQAQQVSQAKPTLPPWAIPAGIGAAVLIGVSMMGGRRRR